MFMFMFLVIFVLLVVRRSQICSEEWMFETIVCQVGVTNSGKYAYEYQINTMGIHQVGWTCEGFQYQPVSGSGVGDDDYSYCFDGSRVKKWHGNPTVGTAYGVKWAVGDTVTAVIDLDLGQMVFYLNGISLGTAFSDFAPWHTWHPSISVTSEQCGALRFGGKLDPFKFPLHGVQPFINATVKQSGSFELVAHVDDDDAARYSSDFVYQQLEHQLIPKSLEHRHVGSGLLGAEGISFAESNAIETPPLTFYFEATLGFDGLVTPNILQVGLLLTAGCRVSLLLDTASSTLVWITTHNMPFDDQLLQDSLESYVQAIGQTCASKQQEQQQQQQRHSLDSAQMLQLVNDTLDKPCQGIELVHIESGIKWNTGIVVGCGFSTKDQVAFFTRDGVCIGIN
eukprot:jgi/Hompol1/214/HPOL_001512-RA